MTIAFDASVELERFATLDDPTTWVHTPVATPRGVAVAFIHENSSTDHVLSGTYGGVSMSRIVRGIVSSPDAGAAEWWFLGSGVPTGPRTVSLDLTGAGITDDSHFVSITLSGNADIEVVDFASLVGGSVANPSIALQYGGRISLAVGAIFSGRGNLADLTELSGCTRLQDMDYGTKIAVVSRQSAPGGSDFTIGWSASSDSTAFVAMALSEVTSGTPPRRPRIIVPGEAVHRASRW